MSDLTENVANNVAQEKVQDLDHISQEEKKVISKMETTTLTEKWKNELEDGAYYYTENGIEECHYCEVNGVMELVMPEIEEVLAPVPSYEEWQKLNGGYDWLTLRNKELVNRLQYFADSYFDGLDTKEIAELAKKSIRLTKQHCKDNEENDKLKELLGKCYRFLRLTETKVEAIEKVKRGLVKEIDEVLE